MYDLLCVISTFCGINVTQNSGEFPNRIFFIRHLKHYFYSFQWSDGCWDRCVRSYNIDFEESTDFLTCLREYSCESSGNYTRKHIITDWSSDSNRERESVCMYRRHSCSWWPLTWQASYCCCRRPWSREASGCCPWTKTRFVPSVEKEEISHSSGNAMERHVISTDRWRNIVVVVGMWLIGWHDLLADEWLRALSRRLRNLFAQRILIQANCCAIRYRRFCDDTLSVLCCVAVWLTDE